jgi:hypothetical protein
MHGADYFSSVFDKVGNLEDDGSATFEVKSHRVRL